MEIFENPDPSALLRLLEEMEPRYEPSFVSLGYLIQEMYGTVLSLVSRVLEMERLGAFSKEPRYCHIPLGVEALRRQTEGLMELLQFPDAACQRRGHILQGLREFYERPSSLLLELQSTQLEKLLEDTVHFRMECASTTKAMADQVFYMRQGLEKKPLRKGTALSLEGSGYVSLQEVLLPLGEEAFKMDSLAFLFRKEGAFIEKLEEEYSTALGELRRIAEEMTPFQEASEGMPQGISGDIPQERAFLQIFQGYSTREERHVFREFFASRGGIPEYAASAEDAEQGDISGVDFF